MKNISPALLAFFQTEQPYYRYDLFWIQLANGQIIPASTCPVPVSYQASFDSQPRIYHPTMYGTWERGSITMEADYQPKANTMALTVTCQPEDNILFPGTNTPLMQTVSSGLFDASPVWVLTFYASATQTPAVGLAAYGVIKNFFGTITSVKNTGRSKAEFECTDQLYLLNLQFPINLVTSGCQWTLYDKRCTLVKTAYQCSSNVYMPGSNNLTIVCATNPTKTVNGYTFSGLTGDFTQGTITFTEGQNAGLTAYIRLNYTQSIGGTPYAFFQLGQPLPFPPDSGNTFNCFPGCNKTMSRCSQYANTQNFGGCPFVPNPELAV